MKNSIYLGLSTILCSGVVPNQLMANSNSVSENLSKKMNVIFVLTDDQGYGDLGCNGNENMRTANIDDFAANSIRLSSFHSGTTSAPTRSGLITGNYGNTTGVWHTVMGRSLLDLREKTMPEIFKESGYRTALFGKWHLGDNYPYRPIDRGFDETLYHGGGGVGQTPDYWTNKQFDDVYFRNGEPERQVGYCTDIWFGEAIKFIEENKDKPFFCYITPNAPHAPYNVSEKYVIPYENNDEIPNPGFNGMIQNLDENFGLLCKKVKELGLDDNTIIIFMTDNGTAGGVKLDENEFVVKGYNAGMRGMKGSVYEGGHRVPIYIKHPKLKSADYNNLTFYADVLPTLIDMCGLSVSDNRTFDGISLLPLFEGGKIPSRVICVDTQREENLLKYRNYCVMYENFRLINGKELYDIEKDPEQKTDISDKNPKMVEKLSKEYEKWWKRNRVLENEYQFIHINPKEETVLTIHDAHSYDNLLPAWNQFDVRKGVCTHGYWAVEVEEDGLYEFNLMRWAPESNLPLLSEAPEGTFVPNGKKYPVGKKLNIIGGQICIDGNDITSKISSDYNGKGIPFTVKLKKGQYKLDANLIDNNNKVFSSFYVTVNKLNK